MSNLWKTRPVGANKGNEYELPEVRPRSTVENHIQTNQMQEKDAVQDHVHKDRGLGVGHSRTRKEMEQDYFEKGMSREVNSKEEEIKVSMLLNQNPDAKGNAIKAITGNAKFHGGVETQTERAAKRDDQALGRQGLSDVVDSLGRNSLDGEQGDSIRNVKSWAPLENPAAAPLRHPFVEEDDFDKISKPVPGSFDDGQLGKPKQERRFYPPDGPKEGVPYPSGFPNVNPFVADHAVIHNAITNEEVEEILAWKTDPNFHMEAGTVAGVIDDPKFHKQREEIQERGIKKTDYDSMDDYDNKYRICNIYYDKRTNTGQIPPGSLLNKIVQGILSFNQENFKFDCGGILSGEWPNIMEYNVGGHYDWHIDVFHTETTPVPACRKLSISLLLNQQGVDFEGGGLEFQGNPIEVVMNKGDLCVFPSYLPHRINPVTKGQRNCLVGWIHGPSWK